MPLNPNIALIPAQTVQDQGRAIDSSFNSYYNAQQNKRQNALLDLSQQRQERDEARQNALLDLQNQQNDRQEKQFNFEMDSAKGAQLYRTFQGLSQLAPEYRQNQIELMKDGLRKYGFDDDDWEDMATDEGVKMGLNFFSRYAPITKAEIGRYKTEELPDGSKIVFDSATSATRELSKATPVDLSILPDSMRNDVSKLPRDSQEKIVNEFASPKAQAEMQEKADQEKKGQQVKERTLALVEELLGNEDGVKSVIGAVDSWMPTVMSSSRDAEAGLEDLRNLLTVENLGLMSGVLSETDMKIIQSVGASGLSGSQERVLSRLREMRSALKGGEQGLDDSLMQFMSEEERALFTK